MGENWRHAKSVVTNPRHINKTEVKSTAGVDYVVKSRRQSQNAFIVRWLAFTARMTKEGRKGRGPRACGSPVDTKTWEMMEVTGSRQGKSQGRWSCQRIIVPKWPHGNAVLWQMIYEKCMVQLKSSTMQRNEVKNWQWNKVVVCSFWWKLLTVAINILYRFHL